MSALPFTTRVGGRSVGVGVAAFRGGMPLVLRASEGRNADRADEEAIRICLGVVEGDARHMVISLIPIHHQQRPLPVRRQDSIGEIDDHRLRMQ